MFKLDRAVITHQYGEPRIRDPIEQPLVATIKSGTMCVRQVACDVSAEFKKFVCVTGVKADDVPLLHRYPVRIKDTHQVVITDRVRHKSVMLTQVYHDPAALHTMPGHMFDAKVPRTQFAEPRIAVLVQDAEAVVLDRLGYAITVCVEQRAHVCKRIPLRRVLVVQQDRVITDDTRIARVKILDREIEYRKPIANDRLQNGRLAPWIGGVCSRHIQGQAQTEALAYLDLFAANAVFSSVR